MLLLASRSASGAAALVLLAVVAQALLHAALYAWCVVYRPRRGGAASADACSQEEAAPRPGHLRLLQLNAWSGSTYAGELEWATGFQFRPYEPAARREARRSRGDVPLRLLSLSACLARAFVCCFVSVFGSNEKDVARIDSDGDATQISTHGHSRRS